MCKIMLAKVLLLCYSAANTQICHKQRNYIARTPPSFINALMVQYWCVSALSLPVLGSFRKAVSKKASLP